MLKTNSCLLRWDWLAVLVLFLCTLLFVSRISVASDTSPWSLNTGVSVQESDSYSANNLPLDTFLERPCNKTSYVNSAGAIQRICTIQTSGYRLTHDAKISAPNSTSINPTYNKLNTSSRLVPIVGSADLLEIQGKESDARLRKIHNAFTGINFDTKKSPAWAYIMSTDQVDLMDSLNNTYLFSDYYLNISRNGEWIVSQNSNGIYTYNISSGVIQYIRSGLVKNKGYSPKLMLAVSDSGRYVAVYTGRENKLDIIDTASCSNKNAIMGKDALCSTKPIMPDIKTGVANLYLGNQLQHLQFENENTISFYAPTNWIDATNFSMKKVLVTSSGTPALRAIDYLALGDSYASGEGVGKYKDGSDVYGTNMCHVSTLSYPYQLANRGVTAATESVACSGARIKDIMRLDKRLYSENNPQSMSYLSEQDLRLVINNFYVGSTWQNEFVKQYQPRIITLSVGGNDIGFSKIISACVTGAADCYSSTQQRKQLVSTIQYTYTDLVKTYTTLKSNSPGSSIYVIGYPQIAKEDGNCATNVGLSNKEIIFTNKLITYLNSVIQQATKEAGVLYVDTQKALYGRRLCEVDSSLVAANGLTAGNTSGLPKEAAYILGTNGPLAQESYHPNLFGHSMYAKTIQEATNSFSLAMPTPTAQNIYAPSNELDALLDGGVDDFNYSINSTYIYNESISKDVVWQGGSTPIYVPTYEYGAPPNTNFNVVLYSNPINIGTVTSDANGVIDSAITIPKNIPTGMHTIHITGTTVNGGSVDIQKIVYVAANIDDIDGDKIKNIDEKCLLGEPAMVDVDGDEIDDACDGYIGEPKQDSTNEEDESTPPNTEQPPIDTPPPSDKELPQSESRPDWLLMKEREYADEQAVANQSATVSTDVPVKTSVVVTRQNSTVTSQPTTVATAQEQTAAQQTNKQIPQNTTVAGVSSAVESKQATQSNPRNWWLYILLIAVSVMISFGFYRLITIKNRV